MSFVDIIIQEIHFSRQQCQLFLVLSDRIFFCGLSIADHLGQSDNLIVLKGARIFQINNSLFYKLVISLNLFIFIN